VAIVDDCSLFCDKESVPAVLTTLEREYAKVGLFSLLPPSYIVIFRFFFRFSVSFGAFSFFYFLLVF